jgi:hypothetical protein
MALFTVSAIDDSAAIGTGYAPAFGTNRIDSIVVNEGYFPSLHGQESAAIGTGKAGILGDGSGHNSVGNHSIKCQFFKTALESGPGIGTGSADGGSTQVGSIVIYDGNYFMEVEVGSGIGTGHVSNSGVSGIENITILRRQFFNIGAKCRLLESKRDWDWRYQRAGESASRID